MGARLHFRTSVRLVPLAILALAAAGCYTHVPVGFERPEQGRTVRAELTPAGEQDVIPTFGPGVRELSGIVLENDTATMSVLVDALYGRQGQVSVDAQPFRLQQSQVATMYERQVSLGRSVLFGAALVTGAVLLIEALEFAGRQFESEDTDPPGPLPGIPIRVGW